MPFPAPAPTSARVPLLGLLASAALGAGACYAVIAHSSLSPAGRVVLSGAFAALFAAVHRFAARRSQPLRVAFAASVFAVAFWGPLLFFLTLGVFQAFASHAPFLRALWNGLAGAAVGFFFGSTFGLILGLPLGIATALLHVAIVGLTRRLSGAARG